MRSKRLRRRSWSTSKAARAPPTEWSEGWEGGGANLGVGGKRRRRGEVRIWLATKSGLDFTANFGCKNRKFSVAAF